MVIEQHDDPNPISRCTVTRTLRGWDVKEEQGSQVLWQANYTDWHRVERAVAMFDLHRRGDDHSTKR